MQNIDIESVAKNYLDDLKSAIDKINLEDIKKIADVLIETYRNDNTVFILGNGGSASTASHMACDLGKGTLNNVYNPKEKRLRIISLTDNIATMTAFANDLSYDDMFTQQLHNLIKPNDVVVGISGSGNTPNIIKALIYAKTHGAITIGFLGYSNGGKAKGLVDLDITIQSNNYGIIEDLHLALNHLLTVCLSYMKTHADNNSQDSNYQKESAGKHLSPEWTERSNRR